ncbi:PhoU domain-containing protein [Amycolatopsis sp. FDAARGOS 1241]|uniref:phosphate signaling complex PhoU family protein n=1 Tax=Amycolatopsis sp. FDAARGOS 1241 TaxID=2778070 RepID=UPI00194FD212|nr:PhoU domain-containing protein [Amycolatopsis sp. FDAARGOS 1241]QRP47881.1 phosphate transport system regulatory protein PhoU [Amycolatopsis sp. FDAARGOS 1241]
MCLFAAQAMRDASTALLTVDRALAERVIAGDVELDMRRARCEAHAQKLLASRASVTMPPPFVLAVGYCADTFERMGDLAVRIAEIAWFCHPRSAVPAVLMDRFGRMGELTATMAERLTALLAEPVEGMYAELDGADTVVDALHGEVLDLVATSAGAGSLAEAFNAVVLSRFYERFGDQVVSVAGRVEFTVTGILPG